MSDGRGKAPAGIRVRQGRLRRRRLTGGQRADGEGERVDAAVRHDRGQADGRVGDGVARGAREDGGKGRRLQRVEFVRLAGGLGQRDAVEQHAARNRRALKEKRGRGRGREIYRESRRGGGGGIA